MAEVAMPRQMFFRHLLANRAAACTAFPVRSGVGGQMRGDERKVCLDTAKTARSVPQRCQAGGTTAWFRSADAGRPFQPPSDSRVTPASSVIWWFDEKRSSTSFVQKQRTEERLMTDLPTLRPWWNRRDFLKSSAAVVAGVYAMRWRRAAAADIPLEFDGSKFQLKAGEPNPKHGGVVRMGIP